MKMIGHKFRILFSFLYQSTNVNRTFRLATILLLFLSCVPFDVCGGYKQNTDGTFEDAPHLARHRKQNTGNSRNYFIRRPFSPMSKDILRSGRHRREPSAEPVAEVLGSSSSNSRSHLAIAQDQVQNSHKPKFEKCHEYEPRVKEESVRGKNFLELLWNRTPPPHLIGISRKSGTM